jgi:hypothetical protein
LFFGRDTVSHRTHTKVKKRGSVNVFFSKSLTPL